MTYNIHTIDFRMTNDGWKTAVGQIPQSKGVYVHFGNIKVGGVDYYIPLRVGQTRAKSGFYGRWIANSGSHKQAFMATENKDYKYIQHYPNYAYFFDQLRGRSTILIFIEIQPEEKIRIFENALIQSLKPVWELPQLKQQAFFNEKMSFKELLHLWKKQNEHYLIANDLKKSNQLEEYLKSKLSTIESSVVKSTLLSLPKKQHSNSGSIAIQSGDENRIMSSFLMKQIVQKVGMVRRGNNPSRGSWYYPHIKPGCKILEEDGYLVAGRMEQHVFDQMIQEYQLYGNPRDDFKWKEMTVADFKVIMNSILRNN